MLILQEREFETLVQYMRDNFGINLSQKRNLIEGRLSNHLKENGYTDYQEYLKQVFSDVSGYELANLVNRLTTNHTFFMREATHFDFLQSTVLPALEKSLTKKEIKVWSAGCSSGEEPYTLAMLMHDHFTYNKSEWDTRILATDISAKVLDQARKGLYSATSVESLPKPWLTKYFQRSGTAHWEVTDKIKQEVVYRSLNLIQDSYPLKSKFHIIFCRNVMIYFDKQTKIELIKRFYDLTEPGGYLFIGHAESIGRDETAYNYVQPAVYQKKA